MRRPRSVRARLTLWYASVLALSVLVFAVAVYLLVRTRLMNELEDRLAADAAAVVEALDEGPGELRELEEYGAVALFRVAQDGRVLYRSAGWRNGRLDAALAGHPPGTAWEWRSPRGRLYHLRSGRQGEGPSTLAFVVARDAAAVHESLRSLWLTFLLGFPGVLALAAVGGYFLAGRVLSPVGAMAEKARAISAESLSDRLPVEDPDDEFGRLATVFNSMLERLERSFEELRRFTADASHELRTPLTAIRSVGEVGLQQERDPDGLRNVIGSMLEESDRLTGIVDALLAVTRSGTARPALDIAEVNLLELAREVAELLQVLAEEKAQRLSVDGDASLVVRADVGLLRQALVNLVDNAVKYGSPGAAVEVTVGVTEHGEPFVAVRDEGPGISPEHRERVFDRFYRAERERSREAPGAGLGLAIARRAVEAQGGRIELESEVGRGSTFRIVLPADRTRGREG